MSIEKDPFGDLANFNMLMKDLVTHIADYQARHKIDFRSLMALLKTFMKIIVEDANEDYLTLYAHALFEHGIDQEGNDI